MNKVMSYQIVKPIGCSWNEFGKVAREAQKQTRIFMNKAMQILFSWQQYSNEYKLENGKYPSVLEVYKYKTISGYIYDKLKNEINIINTGNLSTSLQGVDKKFKSDNLKILKGEMSLPTYKADIPIDLHNKNISVKKDNGSYFIELSLLSRNGKALLNTDRMRYECLIKVKRGTQKSIIDKCIDGEYKIAASKIIYKKNKWFLNLCYAFENNKNELNMEKIMGVDLGVINAAYMGFNFDKYLRECISGDDIIKNKIRLSNNLSNTKSKRKYCGTGSIGHGRKNRMSMYDRYSNHVSHYTDTINHGWSKFIVDTAVKYNCGSIQMENLNGINKINKFIKHWTYYDLQQKIEYKAKEKGIKVIKINPKYTSQRCSECGYIHIDNRPETQKFICQKCGHTANADFNAARNISIPNIDIIIEETINKQNSLAV